MRRTEASGAEAQWGSHSGNQIGGVGFYFSEVTHMLTCEYLPEQQSHSWVSSLKRVNVMFMQKPVQMFAVALFIRTAHVSFGE